MLYAKFVHPNWGRESDQRDAKKAGLEINKLYEVSSVSMGQSYTYIYLVDFKGCFNSVQFEFYEEGKEIDIYDDPRYNPYI
jgi:hypothetical protein